MEALKDEGSLSFVHHKSAIFCRHGLLFCCCFNEVLLFGWMFCLILVFAEVKVQGDC